MNLYHIFSITLFILAFLLIYLSRNVILMRRKHKISYAHI